MTKLNIDTSNKKTTTKRKYYFFKCDCGDTVSRRGDCKSKYCNSSNCSKSKLNRHGKSENRLYKIWSGMRDRCINNRKDNVHYKFRGIKISKKWDKYIDFEKWALDNGYDDSLTIDRKNIDGNYEPGNCEWITREENSFRQCRDGHSGFAKPVNVVVDGISFRSISDAARSMSIISGKKLEQCIKAISYHSRNGGGIAYEKFVIGARL